MATSILSRDQIRGNVPLLRAKNRAAMKRFHAVQNVYERLEVFGVLVLMDAQPGDGRLVDQVPSSSVIRNHAERIVDAVLAFTREVK